MEDITDILNTSATERNMPQSTRHPLPTPAPSDPQLVPKPEPFLAPTTPVDTAKVALLYNVTTQKLDYITVTELYTLSIHRRVAYTYIPIWTRKLDIHSGCRGLGSSGHMKAKSVWLPCYVVFWRIFGWWPIMWLVDGEKV